MSHRSNILWLFTLLLTVLVPSLTVAAEESVIKVAGWDVYRDPEHPNKTIGFRSFEERTGVKIEFAPLSTLDEILTIAESEEHVDVYLISNEGIEILWNMGLVNPIDLSRVPHYNNLHDSLQYSEWSQFDSKVYAVPWAWGPTGLMYDQDLVTAPTSWNALWNPEYKGKVSMWDDISMVWTTALSLGYSNVYNLTRPQLKQVKDKLLEFNRQAATYYAGGGDEIKLALQGEVVAFNGWYDPSAQLKAKGKNFKMIIPKEGAVGMFDSYMIAADRGHSDYENEPVGKDGVDRHQLIAHQYINHQISPEVQKEMAEITGLSPANIETLPLLSREQIIELHLNEPDYFDRMLLWDHMPRKNLYLQLLDEVRADWKAQAQ